MTEGPVRSWVERLTKRKAKQFARTHPLTPHADNENTPAAANDTHDVNIAVAFDHLFAESWQNADRPVAPEHAELYKLAEQEARRELQRTLNGSAMLTLPPEAYMQLTTQMQQLAHEMVRETRDLTAGAAKTHLGSNVLRQKVKQSVQKFIGDTHGPSHAHCAHTTDGQPKQVPTLSHICGIELRLPSLFHQHS